MERKGVSRSSAFCSGRHYGHASPTGLLKNQMSFHLLCNSGAILPEISSDCLEGFPVVERCSDLSAFVKG